MYHNLLHSSTVNIINLTEFFVFINKIHTLSEGMFNTRYNGVAVRWNAKKRKFSQSGPEDLGLPAASPALIMVATPAIERPGLESQRGRKRLFSTERFQVLKFKFKLGRAPGIS